MVHLLAEELVRRGHCGTVTLVAFDSIDSPEIRQKLRQAGVDCYYWPKKAGFSFKLIFKLLWLIIKKRIRVIHTNETAPLMYASFIRIITLGFLKIVHTQHSFIHLKYVPSIARYDRFFSHFANRIAAVSDQVRNEYELIGVNPQRVKTILNGVEFPKSDLTDHEIEALRQKLGMSHFRNKIWFVSLARLHPQKGQDHLIRIWAKLPDFIRAQATFIFVGPETYAGERARLEGLAQESPTAESIHFVGPQSNPVQWLQAADIFMSGSEYEGMPLAPIESAAAGMPLLLSNIQGHQLLAPHAYFFEFNDPQGAALVFANVFKSHLEKNSNHQQRLNDQKQSVRKLYSSDGMAERYEELYASTLTTFAGMPAKTEFGG
jgi:glycosyltransferase involved in cell wall biosynthesis